MYGKPTGWGNAEFQDNGVFVYARRSGGGVFVASVAYATAQQQRRHNESRETERSTREADLGRALTASGSVSRLPGFRSAATCSAGERDGAPSGPPPCNPGALPLDSALMFRFRGRTPLDPVRPRR